MKIEQLTVQQKRLSFAEAELWVIIHVSEKKPTLQLRGRITGPFCSTLKTIQVAYPIKQIDPPGVANNVLVGRVLIPDPNLWTAETPYLYDGTVELWSEGKLVDSKPIRAAFKSA